MEKLELKHLAPYLPYGLKCQWLREDDNKLIVSDLTISDYHFLIRSKRAKPILRPLSDLTKEEFKNINYCDDEYEVKYEEGFVFIVDKCEVNYNELTRINDIIEWFYENHFDVFGLIEKDLAIDINTLKQ